MVNASIAEWVNYTTYDRMREAKISLRLSLKQLRVSKIRDSLKKILSYGVDLSYQHYRQDQIYKKVKPLLDLAEDHRIHHLDRILGEEEIYSFDVGTEACLSIPGILEYVHQGYNGVVNVYPFTCMPSTITSSIIRPIMNQKKVPYLDTPYDGSFQPGREAAIRTFMYQAQQHFQTPWKKWKLMKTTMLINAVDPEEYRIAFLKDGKLDAFQIETSTAEQKVGNIYKGVVERVEPKAPSVFCQLRLRPERIPGDDGYSPGILPHGSLLLQGPELSAY